MWTSLGVIIQSTVVGEGWGHVPPPRWAQKAYLCLKGDSPVVLVTLLWDQTEPRLQLNPQLCLVSSPAHPVSFTPLQVSPNKSLAQESLPQSLFLENLT